MNASALAGAHQSEGTEAMLTAYNDVLVKDWLDTPAGAREEAKAKRCLRRYQLAMEKARRIEADRQIMRARAS